MKMTQQLLKTNGRKTVKSILVTQQALAGIMVKMKIQKEKE